MLEQASSRTSKKGFPTLVEALAVIRGIERDTIKRFEAYPAGDVEMDVSGPAVPDDEFHEEQVGTSQQRTFVSRLPNRRSLQSCPKSSE